MPQEKHDARKLERELKIKFEWREADKNLEKEVRNQPLDVTAPGMDIMQLETRSWKGNDPVTPMSAPNANYGGNKNGFRSRNGGGGFSGGRGRGPRRSSEQQQPSRQQPLRPGPPRPINDSKHAPL